MADLIPQNERQRHRDREQDMELAARSLWLQAEIARLEAHVAMLDEKVRYLVGAINTAMDSVAEIDAWRSMLTDKEKKYG